MVSATTEATEPQERTEGDGPLGFTTRQAGSSPLPAQTGPVLGLASSPANPLGSLALPPPRHCRSPGSCPGAAEHKSLVSNLGSALGAPRDLRWPRPLWVPPSSDPFLPHCSPLSTDTPNPDPSLEKGNTRAGTTGPGAHALPLCQAQGRGTNHTPEDSILKSPATAALPSPHSVPEKEVPRKRQMAHDCKGI